MISSMCLIALYSLGYGPKPISDLAQENLRYNPIGHWDFYCLGDTVKQLIISADGTAATNSGTKYRWDFSDDEIKIFIPNTVLYDGWFVDEVSLEGNAYSQINKRSWRWKALKNDVNLNPKNLLSGKWLIINEISDLQDNQISFLDNHKIFSNIYENGEWFLEDQWLIIETAYGYIKYKFRVNKNIIEGTARNQAGISWNCKLKKI